MLILFMTMSVAGAYLIVSAALFQRQGMPISAKDLNRHTRQFLRGLEKRVNVTNVSPSTLLAFPAILLAGGAVVGYLLFGTVGPTIIIGSAACLIPFARTRSKFNRERVLAHETWPRIIEEVRMLTGSAGLAIPSALFHAGKSAPAIFRPAFESAEREWNLTTDFDRATTVLKNRLADPTADAACETLLIAHQIGGSGVDARLQALVEDRILDVNGRKDAVSKQAGAKFARRFVLIVPVGMALAGLAIGTGRDSYRTSAGQIAVVTALGMIIGCWIWAGHLLRLPEERRVFQ